MHLISHFHYFVLGVESHIFKNQIFLTRQAKINFVASN